MKEKIIELAKEKGFTSEFLYNHPYKYSPKEPLRWYLWMCELQNWLIEEHRIYAYVDWHDCSSVIWDKPKEKVITYEHQDLDELLEEALKLVKS